MEKNNNMEESDEENFFSSISKENNFSVPPDYFDFLPEKIMDRVRLRSQQKKIFFLLKPMIAVPSLAVLSGIIVLFFFFLHKEVVPADDLLSENEIQQVVDNPELYNIDESSITDQYLSSNILYEPVNEEASASDEEIKSYLEDNSDVTTIIN